MLDYRLPPAHPHGDFEQPFPEVFVITGTVRTKSPPLGFSRNMTVIREGESLTLINSVRLDEAGLAKLDALGKVEHVIRLCGFHGMDDPFYKQHYDAKVWALEGQEYKLGFDNAKGEAKTYFEADASLKPDSPLPFAGGKLITIASARPCEGMILLEREGGIMISGDALQNWQRPDAYFNFAARVGMRLLGFIKSYNVGPAWLKGASPDHAELRGLLDHEFDHLIPAHGSIVVGNARAKFRPAIERLA